MRIRKQAKLTGVSISNGISSTGDYSTAPIKLHCQLSKSPWDIISTYQIDGEYSYTPDGSSADSLGAIESAASMKISESDGDVNLSKSNGKDALVCGKTDENLWKCRNEVAEGKDLCQHHLDQLKGDNVTVHATCAKNDKLVETTVAADRHKKKVAPASEPVFIYYSGFRPCWTKRRGAKAERNNGNVPITMEIEEEKKYDYIVDYDSDEEDGDGCRETGRKRARKPIKARSLKSLM